MPAPPLHGYRFATLLFELGMAEDLGRSLERQLPNPEVERYLRCRLGPMIRDYRRELGRREALTRTVAARWAA